MKRRFFNMVTVLLVIGSIFTISFGEITADIPVPEFKGAGIDRTIATVIPAYSKGYELLVNSYYKDVSKNPYEEDVARASALGIIKKEGDFYYRPSEKLTGYEALTYLSRLMGRGATVEQRVLTNSLGMSAEGVKNLFNEEYLVEARALGIITADEERNLANPISREIFGVWTSRAVNLAPIYGDNSNIFGFNDWGDVTPIYRGEIEAIVSEKIMNMGNDGNFRPLADVTRGEAARVITRASKLSYANLGITENFGLITAIDTETIKENGQEINYKDFYVTKADGAIDDIKTSKNLTNNKQEDFVVFKNTMTSSKMLAIGDNVEYLVRDNQVIYANIVNDESIVEKLSKTVDNGDNAITYFGTISDVNTVQNYIDGKYIETRRVRIKNFDGEIFDITVDTELYTGNKNDVIVFKNGVVGGLDILEEGDQIEYLVKDNRTVIYINQKDYEEFEVSGTLRNVKLDSYGNKRITVYDYDDKIVEYPLAEYASVIVNRRNTSVDGLVPGQDVTLKINNGYIISIVSDTFVDNPGFIPTEGKIRMGEIFYVYNDGALVKLNDGSMYRYKIDEDSIIIKGGTDITFRALKEGDKVKLYFSDIYTDLVDKVEIEGIERLVKHIYRGSLAEVNEITNTITLNKPYYLKNDDWTLLDDYSKEIKIDNKTSLFVGNSEIPMRKLSRDYKNNTVYIVVEDAYGRERGVKLAVKTGGEQVEYDSIKRLDKPISMFETYSRLNIEMTDGTIILKDGKLIGEERLESRDNVLVVYEEKRGSKQANVIKIVTARDDIFSKVYMGALEYVGPTKIALSYYTTISNNTFNEVEKDDTERYTLVHGSLIKDITDPKNVKELSLNRFFNSSYERSENKSTDDKGLGYERYYVMFVMNEDNQIIQLNLRHKGLVEGQNIDDKISSDKYIKTKLDETLDQFIFTRGIVDSIDDRWGRVKITDSNDWTGTLGEWTVNSVDTYFEFDENDTIFIKNDRSASRDDIETGDNLYILRLKEKAYIVFIEEE